MIFGNTKDAEEEDVREHFASCGEVKYVRVIRDKMTNLGVGVAYVCFQEKKSVRGALAKREPFKERQLRVKKYSKTAVKQVDARRKREEKKEVEKKKFESSAKKGKIPQWMGKIQVKKGEQFDAVASEKPTQQSGKKKKPRTVGARSWRRSQKAKDKQGDHE